MNLIWLVLIMTHGRLILGIENLRKPVGSELYIYSGGGMSSHNSISVSRLAPLGFSFNFLDTSFTLFNKTKIILMGLYEIKLQNVAYNSMHVTVGLKRCVVNEESSIIKQLVKEGVLCALDFTDFETSVDYIKGKQPNKSKWGCKEEHQSFRNHTYRYLLSKHGHK
ncbi:hypothetical protein CR513_22638, partial [Mucuna pruriens]